MTIRAHRDEPCWEIVYASTCMTPECDSGDFWTHYLTREAAENDLPERQRDHDEPLNVAQSSVAEHLASVGATAEAQR